MPRFEDYRVFRDDGSNDGTAALLDKATGNERPEKVLTHPKNCGKGAALMCRTSAL